MHHSINKVRQGNQNITHLRAWPTNRICYSLPFLFPLSLKRVKIKALQMYVSILDLKV